MDEERAKSERRGVGERSALMSRPTAHSRPSKLQAVQEPSLTNALANANTSSSPVKMELAPTMSAESPKSSITARW